MFLQNSDILEWNKYKFLLSHSVIYQLKSFNFRNESLSNHFSVNSWFIEPLPVDFISK